MLPVPAEMDSQDSKKGQAIGAAMELIMVAFIH
jgi:hypothetical protein